MPKPPVNFTILLNQVNRLRNAVDGMEALPGIPKGALREADDCPLARALSNGIKTTVDRGEVEFHYPFNSTLKTLREAVKRIKAAGFVVLNEADIGDDWYSDADRAAGVPVQVKTTKTMNNFIMRFDNEDFEDLIQEGY